VMILVASLIVIVVSLRPSSLLPGMYGDLCYSYDHPCSDGLVCELNICYRVVGEPCHTVLECSSDASDCRGVCRGRAKRGDNCSVDAECRAPLSCMGSTCVIPPESYRNVAR
jgi:hypothetical protein